MPARAPSLSPPPLKRRRISPPPPSSSTSVPPPPSSSYIRIVSWNINGISAYLQPPITSFFRSSRRSSVPAASDPSSHPPPPARPPLPPASLRACLRRWSWPQIVCLQEVKIASHDTPTQNRVRSAVNAALDDGDEGPLYDAYFGLPRDKYNARGFGGRVYGVCTLVRRDVAAEVTGAEWDLEGRVLVARMGFRADGGRKMAVVNLYAVNGTEKPYRDSKTGVVVGTRHMWKREVHRRLAGSVRALEQDGWDVIIAGDFNIAREDMDGFPGRRMGREYVASREDFERVVMGDLGMRDTFREVKGGERKFTYRPRGRKWGESMDRVDLILVGHGVQGLREADVLDSEEGRGLSDHCPLWVGVEVGGQGEGEGYGDVKGEWRE